MSKAAPSLSMPPRGVTRFPSAKTAMPDPSWDIGAQQIHAIQSLRSQFAILASQGDVLPPRNLRRRFDAAGQQIFAMIKLSHEGVSRRGQEIVATIPDDESYDLGVTVTYHLCRLVEQIDDILTTFAAHSGGDIALFASRTELRLAALLHRHYLAQNDAYSGHAI
jgi:hypothetical protein